MPGGTVSVFTRVFWAAVSAQRRLRSSENAARPRCRLSRHSGDIQQDYKQHRALNPRRCPLLAIARAFGAMRLSPTTRHRLLPISLVALG